MKNKSLCCPKCYKISLNPYDKKGQRPERTEDIDHLWCMMCKYRIN